MIVHSINPRIQETEAGKSFHVQGQSGLYSKNPANATLRKCLKQMNE